MPDSKHLRTFSRSRFDPRRMRIDRARTAELARTRAKRIGDLIGRATPMDLPMPWLTLRPDRPLVEGKGWIEFTSPSSVGKGNFEDGQYMYAAFDLIFQKDMPDSFSIERPGLSIFLENQPASTMLVEMDVHAHDFPPGDPTFEILAKAKQTMAIPDGHRETIMFLMDSGASIKSTWASGEKFWDKEGSWAFFEARITPIT